MTPDCSGKECFLQVRGSLAGPEEGLSSGCPQAPCGGFCVLHVFFCSAIFRQSTVLSVYFAVFVLTGAQAGVTLVLCLLFIDVNDYEYHPQIKSTKSRPHIVHITADRRFKLALN